MNNFPNRLKTIRKKNNLSQQTVAKNLGITTQAYGLYELGKREPKLETLIKLANFFEVQLDSLLGIVFNAVDSRYHELHELHDFGEHKHLGVMKAAPTVIGRTVKTAITGIETKNPFKDENITQEKAIEVMKEVPLEAIGIKKSPKR